MKYNKISPEQSYSLRALRQVSKVPVAAIIRAHKMKLRNVSKSTVYRHSKLPLCETKVDGRIKNRNAGRSSLLDNRHKSRVIREIKRFRSMDVDFNAKELFTELIDCLPEMHRTTFCRALNKWGYHYLTNLRKGILSEQDYKKRVKYAKTIKTRFSTPEQQLSFWRSIMFVDVVGFQYKTNPYDLATTPKAKSWRTKSEFLKITRKGAKEGVKTVRYLVGITYGKGVSMCVEMAATITGVYYAHVIALGHFEEGLTEARIVLQDNDSRQNEKANALKAFERKKIRLERIPPRSPDVNIIENLFANVKRQLNSAAKEQKLKYETEVAFKARVVDTLNKFSVAATNKLIDSLPKRIDLIIAGKGHRIKY